MERAGQASAAAFALLGDLVAASADHHEVARRSDRQDEARAVRPGYEIEYPRRCIAAEILANPSLPNA
jgi:hypothetical protein